MRRPVAPLIAALMLAPAALAQAPGAEPAWQALAALPKADRALAERSLAAALEGIPAAEAAALSEQAGGATVPAKGGPLLLVRLPQTGGNCGRFFLEVYPAKRDAKAKPLAEMCLDGLRVVARPEGMPDLVVPSSDLADEVLRWDGQGWSSHAVVESLKPDLADPERLPLDPEAERALGAADLGPLAAARELAGGYAVVPALQLPGVRARLQAAYGADYPRLLRALGTRGPWEAEGGCLAVAGTAPAEGGSEEAVLALCAPGRVQAALLTGGRLLVLGDPADPPPAIRGFIERVGEIDPGLAQHAEWLR
ncbi:MAG TPA: hypothetical protein VEH84_16040 [Alphaproteobacteria bacterium]|nr:hypothetical protein [Alphaproteobacteria bacterium]